LVKWTLRALDAHIRRRFRAIVLRHWQRKRTIARKFVALGVPRRNARRRVHAGHKPLRALSHIDAVGHVMNPRFFEDCGLIALSQCTAADTSP